MSTAGWMPRASSRSSARRGGEILDRLVEQLRGQRGVALELAAGQAERQREADEVLLGAVVQVALDPAPGVVRRGDDAGARGAQLLLGGEPVGDVAHVAEEERAVAVLALDRGDRQLDGELVAVAAHGGDLDAPVEQDGRRRRRRSAPGPPGGARAAPCGTIRSAMSRPIASAALQPNVRSAAGFHSTTVPVASMATMQSSAAASTRAQPPALREQREHVVVRLRGLRLRHGGGPCRRAM